MKIRRAPLHKRIPRSAIRTVVGIFLFIALLVGAGAAYTWYVGKNAYKNKEAFAEPVEVHKAPAIKAAETSPKANVGVAVQSLTTPVAPGSNASIFIQTNPDVVCQISVEYNHVASKDSGLTTKTADEYGLVSWSWTVDTNAPIGKWPVIVTCTSQIGKSGVVKGDLEVAKG